MKNQLSRLTVILALTLTGSALLMAQNSGRNIAEIPFDFQLQDKVLPSGTYSVTQSTPSGILHIRNEGTGEMIAALAPMREQGKTGEAKLVFRCYSDRCFLSWVWFGDGQDGYGVVKGRAEKDAAGHEKPAVLATIRMK